MGAVHEKEKLILKINLKKERRNVYNYYNDLTIQVTSEGREKGDNNEIKPPPDLESRTFSHGSRLHSYNPNV